ncbi:PREDICTED: histone deacetylase 8 [Tarenaya hassleriana]|uniref:histone deacetylase 8 n=1 Tax=Tarenaya hassleriana TaxID=28532 RepID=UPI00053C506D|nr:PREDICTED: histone deacetylase 8 [Tarenaya hassleriana]
MATASSLSASTPACYPATETSHVDVFWDDGMLRHNAVEGVFDTGVDPGFLDVLEKHPENSDRVRNMVSILRRGPISPYVRWLPGRRAILPELLTFHSPEYVNKLIEADKSGERCEIGGGTFMSPGSWDAALLAAGTTLSAMQHILEGHGKIAYALVRPPGHHAQPTQADGYCFLNNAGIAVNLALNSGCCSRIAVIDIDVHYGNGTAEGFYRSDKVLTVSLHMNHGSWGPSHPQNGSVDELGEGDGYGYNLNVPLPNGTGDRGYEYAMAELVVPAVRRFAPDMVVLVFGQDSSAFDPNGRQCLTMDGYRRIGETVRELSEEFGRGRLLIVQEGGYHVTYSAYCLHALLEGVLKIQETLLSDPLYSYPEDEAFAVKVVDSIKSHLLEAAPLLSRT